MRVRYSLPVRGTLRVVDGASIKFNDHTFRFETDKKSGYVVELIVELANVDKDHWPTISQVEQDSNTRIPRFPFEVNVNVLRFTTTEPYITNLEGYLSIFGLEAIGFEQLKEEWVPDSDDERTSMLSGYTVSRTRDEPIAEPLKDSDLARCIVAASKSDLETEALAFFRMGQLFFHDGLYVDSIKYLYLCIEHLFANRKTSKDKTLSEFRKHSELKSAIEALFFKAPHKPFERVRAKYQKRFYNANADDFLEFFFHLRGATQHARQSIKWHPSRQRDFEDEALCMMHLVEEICISIVNRKLAAVPVS